VPLNRTFCLDFNNYLLLNGLYVSLIDIAVGNYGFQGKSARFNGISSHIEVPAFEGGKLDKFTFSLWFNRTCGPTDLEFLLYNGDCKQNGSVQIRSESSSTVGAGIITDYTNGMNAFQNDAVCLSSVSCIPTAGRNLFTNIRF